MRLFSVDMAPPIHQHDRNLSIERDGLRLRCAQPADSAFAFATMKAAFRGYVENLWGWDEKEQLGMHARRFASQDIRVISLRGADVGIMAIEITSACIKVNQLFLRPVDQGRRIGEKCMERICDEARRLAIPVRLRVLKVNPRALAFYRRAGFSVAGETDNHINLERWP